MAGKTRRLCLRKEALAKIAKFVAKEKPDDAVLFDLLAEWAPDVATRTAILVQNPASLYGFPATA